MAWLITLHVVGWFVTAVVFMRADVRSLYDFKAAVAAVCLCAFWPFLLAVLALWAVARIGSGYR